MSEPFDGKGAGQSKSKLGYVFVFLFLLAGTLAWLMTPKIDPRIEDSAQSYTYEFEGFPMPYGEHLHSIYRIGEVDVQVAERFGAYLEQIGYFSPKFGGIVQLKSTDAGYDVYLTYKKEYWDNVEFLEEVSSLAKDLERYVLLKPVSLIVVDEDEDGVYRKTVQ
jgi:hypothetical protein